MRCIISGLCACFLLSSLLDYAAGQDYGDGAFTTPPLQADFPDPDNIRVDDDFYLVSTTFLKYRRSDK